MGWIASLLLASLVACSSSATPRPQFGHGTLSIQTRNGSVVLSVRTASTAAAKAQGLMNQTHLSQNAGMVFVSQAPTETPFWMKDTTIPLSVAFWNSRDEIVDMLDMSPCTSDPCPLYRSTKPYVGAVEVNQGFLRRHGVTVGDRVELRTGGSP
jgi:uncharacterized membrane protein (UPF0127 family)